MLFQCLALIYTILAVNIITTQETKYEFILDNEEVFDKCSEKPDSNDIHDMVDLSDFIFEFHDGHITGKGNATMIWQGVQPSDRIEASGELMKFQRGTWQPTTWSGRVLNFCSVQYDVKTMWYQTWSSHIPEDERKCLNNYGHVYHYRDMDVNTVDEFITNMEGRYKIVIQISAFDELNVKRPNSICFEIIGEYIKYKQ